MRIKAAYLLGESGPTAKEHIPALLTRVTSDPHESVRLAAIEALAKIGVDSGQVLALIPTLQDPNWTVRHRAAEMLIARQSDALVPRLMEQLLSHQNWPPHNTVTELMGHMPDTAIEPLRQMIENTEVFSTYRSLGAVTLLSMGPPGEATLEAIAQSTSVLTETRLAALVTLAYAGDEYLPLLLDALPHATNEMLPTLAKGLAQLGAPARQALTTQLDSPDQPTRLRALRLLGEIGAAAQPAVPHILRLLDEGSDGDTRNVAFASLGQIGQPAEQIVPVLLAVATAPGADPEVRVGAIAALGRLDPSATPGLPEILAVLRRESPLIRPDTLDALIRIDPGSADVMAFLLTYVTDAGADMELRTNAAARLGAMGAQAAPAVPALISLLGAESDTVDNFLIDALGKIGEPAVAPLIAAMKSATFSAHDHAVDALVAIGPPAVPGLAELLRRSDEAQRLTVVTLFRRIGPGAIDGLRVAMNEFDGATRTAARDAVDELFAKDQGTDDLRFGETFSLPAAIPFLIDTLGDANTEPDTRVEALQALGMIGPTAAAAAPAVAAQLALADQHVDCEALFTLVLLGPAAHAASDAVVTNLSGAASPSTLCSYSEEHRKTLDKSSLRDRLISLQTELALHHDQAPLWRVAIDALGAFGSHAKTALPLLQTALAIDTLRRPAAEALGAIGADAIPTLLEVLDATRPIDCTAGSCPDELATAIGRVQSVDMRRSALYALGLTGAENTAPIAAHLTSIVKNPAEAFTVRAMAATVLQQGGSDMTQFWADSGLANPATRICPHWEMMGFDGSRPPDRYNLTCDYQEAPQAPSVQRIFRALLRRLRGR